MRLAIRAVIGFIAGVTNALHFGSAARARLAIFPMHSHFRPEGPHLLGKLTGGFGAQALRPFPQRSERGVVETLDFLPGQSLRSGDGRKPRAVEDLVRVSIPHATEQARVGQGAFQGVIR